MSQGSYHTARNLSELGDEYRQLLEGTLSDYAVLSQHGSKKHEKLVWTRVLSMPHFAVAGCRANNLDDDLREV